MTTLLTQAAVAYDVTDGVAVITVQNPPVNALSVAVRRGLDAAISRFAADAEAHIAVIIGAGRTFIAGADIKEFGKPPQEPRLPDLIQRIEDTEKPVVAVLHGTALGGGLEVALGAHYRLALPGAKVGLPEVTLGLIPGAGGTQRLPRLIGVDATLTLITSGRPVPAQKALELGIVDQISQDSDPRTAGLVYAQHLLGQGAVARRSSEMDAPGVAAGTLDEWRGKLAQKARGQLSPLVCVDAVEAATTLDFASGMKRERELFLSLLDSPQRAALIHAFFAERKVSKLPELQGIAAREITEVGIIGGGTMGAGIAVSCLLNGLDVTLIERNEDAAAQATTTVTRLLGDSLRRGKLSKAQHDGILADDFRTATDYKALSQADLVIEAVFESMDVKRDVFQKLDAECKAGAILASNTSYLDINEIAAITNRPQDVIGLHFFSPAHVMKLLEVVVPDATAPDVVATGFALAKKLGKIAVRAGVCDGFIGNRILATYRAAADHMVLDGASPYDIDRALKAFGFAMGPFEVSDLAGLDIGWATRKRKAPTLDPRARVAKFADRLCELGRFGQKTGRGFYIYPEGSRRGTPDPEVLGFIDDERADLGITPQRMDDETIVRRYMAAMINEAAKVVAEGIALRPLDVDVTFLSGYGFPRHRGGPMHYADEVGLPALLADLERYAEEDAYFWQPAQLIRDLVANGQTFASLNE
ncbi:FAD-dependent oxidoreductase [Parasedimentitalea marina]|uniref:FAD-dependent oxidoreductase n=1 Tax=Parasedimentitalea marina TaxID=2483033 RepID=A0A3T0N7G8_9RHOB|nr:FAD-dependent oxidoreductase [Parasedimentitalea marina]AZV79986.1 FAD-dependent oxidoreductase [Parasedimentitalea marina]